MNYTVSKEGAIFTIGDNFADKNSIVFNNYADIIGAFYIHLGSFLSLFRLLIIGLWIKQSFQFLYNS